MTKRFPDEMYDGSVEEIEEYLEFNDDGMDDYPRSYEKVLNALGNYSFDEIITANGMTEEDMLTLLYWEGELGLPTELVMDEDNYEEMEDLQDETEE